MNAKFYSPVERDLFVRKVLSLAPIENSCRVLSVSTACREAGLTEDELAMVVGAGEPILLGEWSVRFSPDASRITFAKRSLPSRITTVDISAPTIAAFDAIDVGLAARRLCEQAWAAGLELSATEAVNRILKQRGLRP